MATRIIVPLDGAARAEKALPYALAVASRFPADIMLLRLTPPTASADEADAAQAYLRDVAHAMTDPSSANPIPAERVHLRVRHDTPESAIALMARLGRADMVVMTPHDRSGINRLVLGSTTTRIVQHAGVPVLVIHPKQRDEPCLLRALLMADPPFAGGPVVVSLDGSATAETILEKAAFLAERLDRSLHLLRVIVPIPPIPAFGDSGMIYLRDSGMATDAAVAQAGEYLVERQHLLRAKGQSAVCAVRVGNAAECIVSYAHEEKAALIAMATHAPGIAGQVTFGSVADVVVRHTSGPVLLVHSREHPQENRA